MGADTNSVASMTPVPSEDLDIVLGEDPFAIALHEELASEPAS